MMDCNIQFILCEDTQKRPISGKNVKDTANQVKDMRFSKFREDSTLKSIWNREQIGVLFGRGKGKPEGILTKGIFYFDMRNTDSKIRSATIENNTCLPKGVRL